MGERADQARESGVLLREHQALYTLDRREVENRINAFTEEYDLQPSGDDKTAYWNDPRLWIRYEWSVDADRDAGGYRVSQREYVSVRTYLSFLLAAPMLLFGITGLGLLTVTIAFGSIPPGVLNSVLLMAVLFLITILLGVLTIIAAIGTLRLFFSSLTLEKSPSPLVDDRDKSVVEFDGYSHRWFSSIFDSVIVVLLFVGVLIESTVVTGVVFAAITVMFVLVISMTILSEENLIIRIRKRYSSPITMPKLGYSLVSVATFVNLPIIVLMIALAAFELLGTDDFLTPLLDSVLAILVMTLGYLIVTNIDTDWVQINQLNVEQEPDYKSHYLGVLLVVGVVGLLSYGAIISVFVLWTPIMAPTGTDLQLTTFAMTLLALYFPAGCLYQLYSYKRFINKIRKHSKPYNLETFSADYPVWVLEETTSINAIAFQTRNEAAIVLTRPLIELTTPNQQAALAAHEQAHLENGDTKLSNRLRVAGTLLLVGQSILFESVDFHEREYRADAYAAERTDVETVCEALSVLESTVPSTGVFSTGTMDSPSLVDDSETGRFSDLIARKFQLFHGTYALTKIHPSPGDRRKRLITSLDNTTQAVQNQT